MRISKAAQAIICEANELGYFPTPGQAREIERVHFVRYVSDETRLSMEAVIEAVMSGKMSYAEEVHRMNSESYAFHAKQRADFYASPEGRALVEGRIEPWKPGQTTLSRACEMGFSAASEDEKWINLHASGRMWSDITDAERNVITDWAIKEWMEAVAPMRAA